MRNTVMGIAALMVLPRMAAAQILVANETTQEQELSPGGRHTGRIVVRNTTDQPQAVRVHAADYSFSADGRTSFGSPGTTARSNAKWVTLSASRITVAPRGETVVGYAVAVPDSAALAGTYWSVVLVESVPNALQARARNGQVGVQPVVRYGVQIATHIAGTGMRQNAISAARLVDDKGDKALELDIANPGSRAYRLELRLDVFTVDGTRANSIAQKTALIYPGTSVRRRFELGTLPPGTYTAMLVADTGANEVFGAQYTLKF
jgi:hypothetical protein